MPLFFKRVTIFSAKYRVIMELPPEALSRKFKLLEKMSYLHSSGKQVTILDGGGFCVIDGWPGTEAGAGRILF